MVAPIAVGPLNVNADEAASALAVGLEADRIVFVTDVPGVYVEGALADRIDAGRADRLLAAGELEGGIVPKLLAAVRAARLGIHAEIGRPRCSRDDPKGHCVTRPRATCMRQH